MEYLNAAVSHLTGQLLVLLHQFLVLLVDGQHFADTVGSCLSLKEDQNTLFHSFTFHIYLNLHFIIINKASTLGVQPNLKVMTGTFQISPVQHQQRRDRSMTRRS